MKKGFLTHIARVRWRFLFWLVCIGSALSAGWLIMVYRTPLPSQPIATGWLWDRSGYSLGPAYSSGHVISLPLAYEEYPRFVRESVVALEDRFFWLHSGVSLRGLVRAGWRTMRTDRLEGGSTIPMQLARHTIGLHSRRTWQRKLHEAWYAHAWTMRPDLSRADLLAIYLNTISLSDTTRGMQAGAYRYFGKPLDQLTRAQIVALLTIAKQPDRYSPYADTVDDEDEKTAFGQRYERLVDRLAVLKVITPAQQTAMLHEDLQRRGEQPIASPLPYVRDFVGYHPRGVSKKNNTNKQNAMNRLSIDAAMTRQVDELARKTLQSIIHKNATEYSVLIVDRETHEIRVMIGGKEYTHPDGGNVNATLTRRQPGSALKPFVYLLAFAQRGYRPDDMITDLPVSYQNAEGYAYTPANYDLQFGGAVTLGEALAASVNIPALKLAQDVGIERLLVFLRDDVGIRSLSQPASHYGVSLALGGGEVTLYELVRAYTVFAGDGVLCDLTIYDSTPVTCRRVVEARYAQMVSQILGSRYLKLRSFAIDSPTDFADRNVVLKTGTSRNFVDNWTVGYTDDYLIGVWVGNKDSSPMRNVSGASGAGEIFRAIVYLLDDDYEPPHALPDDYALSATQSDDTTNKTIPLAYLEITAPLDGTVYGYETDQASEIQAIVPRFATNIDYAQAQWTIDGEQLDTQKRSLSLGDHVADVVLTSVTGAVVGRATTTFVVRVEE